MTIADPPIDYGSVCSGIEAASVAWEPLGMAPAWFAEIAAFPSAVLAHHYPAVPNLGDMTRIAERVRRGTAQAPEVLVGGTPCQAFSIAGARNGLSDPRGALTLKYTELANAIDQIRTKQNKAPAVLVWENVPGVLSDKRNAFGHFLGALAGSAARSSLQGHAGRTLVVCMDPKEQSRGEFLMPNISAWPNDAVVCLLSQVLVPTSIPPKYFLSPLACGGILRRAAKRSKTLPHLLKRALAEQAARRVGSVRRASTD